MKKEKQIIYTESGEKRLAKLYDDLHVDIEKYFRENKYVPGDEFIEITAADIEEISKKITIAKTYKSNYTSFILIYIYCIFGFVLILYGIFYEEIKKLVLVDPRRLVYILGGVFMVLLGLVYSFILKTRQSRAKIQEMLLHQKLRNDRIQIIEASKYDNDKNDDIRFYH